MHKQIHKATPLGPLLPVSSAAQPQPPLSARAAPHGAGAAQLSRAAAGLRRAALPAALNGGVAVQLVELFSPA